MEDTPDVITGTTLICNFLVNVLFDNGATCSFMSNMFMRNLDEKLEPLAERFGYL